MSFKNYLVESTDLVAIIGRKSGLVGHKTFHSVKEFYDWWDLEVGHAASAAKWAHLVDNRTGELVRSVTAAESKKK